VRVWNTIKQSLSHSPEGTMHQTTCGYNVYSVLFTCTHQRSPPIALLTSYRLDIANFAYTPHLTPTFEVTPSNLWKSFTVPETRVFQTPDGEDLVILACLHHFWLIQPCDRQTDRRMDRQTELRWIAKIAVARKNQQQIWPSLSTMWHQGHGQKFHRNNHNSSLHHRTLQHEVQLHKTHSCSASVAQTQQCC